jgi:hypothetical protein
MGEPRIILEAGCGLAARAYLIFSHCSLEMRVEIERSIDRLASAPTPEGTMIFGTRHESYRPHSVNGRFAEVIYQIPAPVEAHYPVENWLILRGKRRQTGSANVDG